MISPRGGDFYLATSGDRNLAVDKFLIADYELLTAADNSSVVRCRIASSVHQNPSDIFSSSKTRAGCGGTVQAKQSPENCPAEQTRAGQSRNVTGDNTSERPGCARCSTWAYDKPGSGLLLFQMSRAITQVPPACR
jgi:hypothetical protein